jgi:hypothetical protein
MSSGLRYRSRISRCCWSTARHSKSSGISGPPLITPLTGNEPHTADILKALELAWQTVRQVQVDPGSEYTRPSEFRLIKSLEGFERLETLTLSAETVYKSQCPENPPGSWQNPSQGHVANTADAKTLFNQGTAVWELSST